MARRKNLAGRLGFEPRQSAPKALDLPLVDRPVTTLLWNLLSSSPSMLRAARSLSAGKLCRGSITAPPLPWPLLPWNRGRIRPILNQREQHRLPHAPDGPNTLINA